VGSAAVEKEIDRVFEGAPRCLKVAGGSGNAATGETDRGPQRIGGDQRHRRFQFGQVATSVVERAQCDLDPDGDFKTASALGPVLDGNATEEAVDQLIRRDEIAVGKGEFSLTKQG